jgi:hypothetical protein
MPKATGFYLDPETGDIKMNRGDTGSFWVKETRKSGDDWTEYDRMLFTIKDAQGNIVLQRFYRLDDQWDQGNGIALIEFHNDDTDTWAPGPYTVERRCVVNPVWDGTPPEGKCEDALRAGVQMIEGDIVRTVYQGSLTIEEIHGEV